MANPVKERWDALGMGARVGLGIGLLVILVMFVLATVWITRDDYQVLFADLDPQDAAVIVAELDRMKAGYRLADNGRTILVDKDQVHKTRLKILGGKGVPLKGTVGFEIFNTSDFGMTEFAQKINYQRALQGELARTIMSFEEVKYARVHLAVAEAGILKRNVVKPKASVTLVLKGDARLRTEQIVGIQRLVAASVAEMDPAAVTVLDQQGVALSRNLDGDNADGGVSSRLELKKSTETYLTKKAMEVLDRAFGPGQAIVSVDVTLTQDNVKITREDVIPFSRKDGEIAGAMTRKRQNMQVPVSRGYEAQAPGELAKVDQSNRITQLSTLEIEYENGKKVEQTVMTPGSLRRISVGVILPGYVEPQKVQRVADIVAMAVGLNPERGDAIAVHSVDQLLGNRAGAGGTSSQLDLPPANQPPASRSPERQPAGVDRLMLLGVTALLVVLGLLFLAALIGRRRAAPSMSADERERTLAQVKNWLQGGRAPSAQGRT